MDNEGNFLNIKILFKEIRQITFMVHAIKASFSFVHTSTHSPSLRAINVIIVSQTQETHPAFTLYIDKAMLGRTGSRKRKFFY